MKYLAVLLFILLTPFLLFSQDWSDYFGSVFDIADFFHEPNAGQYAFPVLLIPLGGLYETMGTAFTAAVLDNSFIEANPAGSAIQDYSELSLVHNNWIADVNFEGFVYTLRFGHLGLATAAKLIYVPFTGYNDWNERVVTTYYSEAVVMANISYNFFYDYYFHGLSLGTTLKAAYRFLDSDIYPNQSALALMLDFGILTRFNFLKLYNSRDKNFALGFSAKNIGPPVMGEPLPSQLTAGFSYSPLRPIILSYDFIFPMLFGVPFESWERFHMALGFKIQMTNFYSLQAGFRYQGGNPRISLGSQINLERLSFIIGYTLDLATQIATPFDRFSIEAKLKLGDGGRAEIARKVDAYYIQAWRARSEGRLYEAINLWEAALELDPSFTPARQNILTTRLELSLAEQLNLRLTEDRASPGNNMQEPVEESDEND